MHRVVIIVIERHLTLTVTSDHKYNDRNEFLRSDLYEKMVLRIHIYYSKFAKDHTILVA